MLDIKCIRENPEQVKANCIRRGAANADVDGILEIDRQIGRASCRERV